MSEEKKKHHKTWNVTEYELSEKTKCHKRLKARKIKEEKKFQRITITYDQISQKVNVTKGEFQTKIHKKKSFIPHTN